MRPKSTIRINGSRLSKTDLKNGCGREQKKIDVASLVQKQLLATRDYAEAIIEAVPPLLVLDEKLCVRTANKSFCKCFKISNRQALNRSIYELGNGEWNTPGLRALLEEVLPRKNSFAGFETTNRFAHIGQRTLLLSGRPVDHLKRILLFIEDVTDRRKSEKSIRTSEIRYRRLFESARDGILMLDPVTRKITDANPFMSELLGYQHKELLGKELWEIGLLKDEKASRSAFRELRRDHFIRYENLPLQNKTGQHHEVEFVSNLYDEDRRKVIQCNIRDITGRKVAEKALQDSEARFRALFDMGPIAVYSCDAGGRIEEYNRRATVLWGRKPKPGSENFCGSYKMYSEDGKPVLHKDCPMADVLSGKIPKARDIEVQIQRPDGSMITVIANIVPLKNGQGQITGAINAFYDISERKHTEEALRESEQRFRAIFNQATAGIAQTDSKGRFTLVNKGYCDLTGRKPAELLGRKIQEITHPDDRARNDSLLKKLEKHKHSFVAEQRYVRPNGHIVWLSNSVTTVKKSRTKEKYFLTVTQDISERVMVEKALLTSKNAVAQHALALEQVVEERTCQLRETISELEGFSYSVSHDMRAPLRAIQSYASFLVEEYGGKLDEQGINYLHQIMRSSVRLDRLIQDVLSYTKILHAKLPMEEVDLDRLVRDVIDTLATDAQPTPPEIQIQGTLPRVMGNEALLAQCVSNLLNNGLKFVVPGIRPRVDISAAAAGDNLVRISFKDNGIGIAPENHQRIFSLFERINSSTAYEGTGIGLTIVRKAVARMGAEAGFDSELGKGSNFWIQIKHAK